MCYNALKERGAASRYLSDVNINVLDPSVGSFWFIKKPCLSVILYKQTRTCTVVAERASRQQQASRPDSLTGWTMLYSRQEPIARSLARGRADQTCHQGEGGEGVKGGTALVLVSPRARHISQVDATFFSLFHPSNSGRDHRLVPDACMQVIISRVSSELLVDRPALSAPNYSSASV